MIRTSDERRSRKTSPRGIGAWRSSSRFETTYIADRLRDMENTYDEGRALSRRWCYLQAKSVRINSRNTQAQTIIPDDPVRECTRINANENTRTHEPAFADPEASGVARATSPRVYARPTKGGGRKSALRDPQQLPAAR